MTYNTLTVACVAGVRKIVIGSSFAVYGLYYPSRPLMPEYLPVDELHPRKPDDPYGLTKLLGEQLADAYASNGGTQIASLRFPGVSRETPHSISERAEEPMARGFGGYGHISMHVMRPRQVGSPGSRFWRPRGLQYLCP